LGELKDPKQYKDNLYEEKNIKQNKENTKLKQKEKK